MAQTIPVGLPLLEDYYRREQLLGHVDSNLSFTIRPAISPNDISAKDIFVPDSTNAFKFIGPQAFANGKGVFQVLPFSWMQQFNSNHPYGWNDGPMISAKGYQTLMSGGFFIKYGILSIQFKPEFVYAANPAFVGYAQLHPDDASITNYYAYHNLIDNPEYYGAPNYNKFFAGQSNLSLTLGGFSLALSTENLWWGPGIYNALILTNNAPGFAHITFNTVKPINIGIGYLELQLFSGKLVGSGLPPLTTTTLSNGTSVYVPKENDWRYFTGLNINYHPKWLPGFTLGLIRTFDSYERDTKGFSGYFPFFTPYSKNATSGNDSGIGDPFPRDQYTSFYARWLFQKAQAEIYFEYSLNDNSYNLTDFIQSPEHSRAYIFGFRKMVALNAHKDQHIMFSGEIDQLSQSPDRIVRQASGYYIHGQVTDGQTNLGQVLGAGTGSGGNLQTAEIDWVSGLKKVGVQFQRYEHDVDFYQTDIDDLNGNSRNWVDFAIGLTGEWNYKNFLLNAKLQDVKSLNYEWYLKNYTPNSYYIPNNTVYNLHAELGITYRF